MSLTRLELETAQDEGLRLKPYKDTVGVLTIGYGLNLEDGITERMALFMMREKLIEAIEDLQGFPFWSLANEARRHALISMRYNLGPNRFRGFTRMIAAANRGDWRTAADEARDSKWYGQVKTRGPRVVTAIETGEHRE